MFLKLFREVKTIITNASLGFTEVLMYKGELEEGAEFRARFPICYVELSEDIVTDYLASDENGQSLTQFELFVCDKDTDEPKILEKVNSVIELFDGTDVVIEDDIFKARYISTQLHAYLPGLGKAYRILIGVH